MEVESQFDSKKEGKKEEGRRMERDEGERELEIRGPQRMALYGGECSP